MSIVVYSNTQCGLDCTFNLNVELIAQHPKSQTTQLLKSTKNPAAIICPHHDS